jgi:hypothetical protein
VTDRATRALVTAAHKEATRKLRLGPSYAAPCPTSREVRCALVETGVTVDRDQAIEWCREAGLPLADMPTETSDEITRRLPTSK